MKIFSLIFALTCCSCMKKFGTIPDRNPDAAGRYVVGRTVGILDMDKANQPVNQASLDQYINGLCKGKKVIGYKVDRFQQSGGSSEILGLPASGSEIWKDIEVWCEK